MYKIAICDDDKKYRRTIKKIIENFLPINEISFYEYESGRELLENVEILYELVFIDIRMPEINGNETALAFRKRNKEAVLVFCSSYFEPTPDSINIGQPFRYIIKDLHDKSLKCEMPTILSEVKRRFSSVHMVTVTSTGRFMRIHLKEILYICLAKRGCRLYKMKGDHIEEIHCKESLGELYEQLKQQGFVYAHNSYIVNLENVEGVAKNVLSLKGGLQLNISRSRKPQFTEALFKYMQERCGLI